MSNDDAKRLDTNQDRFRIEQWEGFETELWQYKMDDGKYAQVVLLNPAAPQLAKWVIRTCRKLKEHDGYPEPLQSYIELLCGQIWTASNAQFPVMGIVHEDLAKDDDITEIYCFKDGVTVGVKGLTGDYNLRSNYTAQPTKEQIAQTLHITDQDITWVGKFARIQSTNRGQYRSDGGRGNVGEAGSKTRENLGWLSVSRDSYQKAWRSPSGDNELMFAWARAAFADRAETSQLKKELRDVYKLKGIWNRWLGGE